MDSFGERGDTGHDVFGGQNRVVDGVVREEVFAHWRGCQQFILEGTSGRNDAWEKGRTLAWKASIIPPASNNAAAIPGAALRFMRALSYVTIVGMSN